jgi:hypothetical protein
VKWGWSLTYPEAELIELLKVSFSAPMLRIDLHPKESIFSRCTASSYVRYEMARMLDNNDGSFLDQLLGQMNNGMDCNNEFSHYQSPLSVVISNPLVFAGAHIMH